MTERKEYTAKQLARAIGVDARQLRKFFRTRASSDIAVGRGGRYNFKAEDLPRVREEFRAWRQRIEQQRRNITRGNT